MLVHLLDALRCPRPHEETWLVASYTRRTEHEMIEGVLGCPTCGTEYEVRDGVARLVPPDEPAAPPATVALPAVPDLALRVAALLDLTDPRMVVLLTGAWTAIAEDVRAVAPVSLLLVGPPGSAASRAGPLDAADGISRVVATAIPIAKMSARAAAVDLSSGAAGVERVVAAVRPGGRLVGPVSMPVPVGCRELARDTELWVAEREAAQAEVIGFTSLRRPKPL